MKKQQTLITKQEFEKLGLSPECFQEIVECYESMSNRVIKKMISEPLMSVISIWSSDMTLEAKRKAMAVVFYAQKIAKKAQVAK